MPLYTQGNTASLLVPHLSQRKHVQLSEQKDCVLKKLVFKDRVLKERVLKECLLNARTSSYARWCVLYACVSCMSCMHVCVVCVVCVGISACYSGSPPFRNCMYRGSPPSSTKKKLAPNICSGKHL